MVLFVIRDNTSSHEINSAVNFPIYKRFPAKQFQLITSSIFPPGFPTECDPFRNVNYRIIWAGANLITQFRGQTVHTGGPTGS